MQTGLKSRIDEVSGGCCCCCCCCCCWLRWIHVFPGAVLPSAGSSEEVTAAEFKVAVRLFPARLHFDPCRKMTRLDAVLKYHLRSCSPPGPLIRRSAVGPSSPHIETMLTFEAVKIQEVRSTSPHDRSISSSSASTVICQTVFVYLAMKVAPWGLSPPHWSAAV